MVLATAAQSAAWAEGTRSTSRADGPNDASRVTVTIVVVSRGGELPQIREVVGQHAFGSASVQWSESRTFDPSEIFQSHASPADVERAVVHVWIDLSRPGVARLYFENGAKERFLVRELAVSPELGEVDREAIGQVLELSIAALVEDERAGMDRGEAESLLMTREQKRPPDQRAPEAPSHATPPRSPANVSSHAPVDVTVSYGAEAFATAIPIVHGPGVAIRSNLVRGAPGLSIWLSGQYFLPQMLETDRIGVELATTALRAGLESGISIHESRAGSRFLNTFAALRLGIGIDWTRVTPLPGSVDRSAVLEPPYSSATPALTAALVLTTTVSSWIDLGAAATLDIDLVRVHYDLRFDDATLTVLSPRSVRPGWMLGITVR